MAHCPHRTRGRTCECRDCTDLANAVRIRDEAIAEFQSSGHALEPWKSQIDWLNELIANEDTGSALRLSRQLREDMELMVAIRRPVIMV